MGRIAVTTQHKGVRAWLLALALAAVMASTGSAAAQDKLRVGKAIAQAFSFVPLDVGIAEGIFKRHGLDIEASSFAGSSKLQQGLAADGIDIGIGSGPELAFVAKGAPVLGVAAMAGRPLLLAMVVMKDGPIHAVADLKGQTVSTSTVGSLTTWLVRELSRQQGWGPDGIKIVHLGEDTAQIAAMRTGETVGAPLDIATIYRLEELGVGRLLYRFGDLVQHFHIHVIYASRKIIARDPDAVRRFLAGWFETIAFMRQNKDATVGISAPVMEVSPAIAARTYDELMPMFSSDGKFDPQALETLRRSFVEMNLLPTAPDMSKLYTEKFLPSAPPL
jgi:ABC-type nitrate/sulfonate/bicarbonate transport system substrate-binding protein